MALQLPPFVFEDAPLKDDEVAAANKPGDLSPRAAAALAAAKERTAAAAAANDEVEFDYICARADAGASRSTESADVMEAYQKIDKAMRAAHHARMVAARTKEELDDAEAAAVRDGVAATLAANAKAAQGAPGKANAEDRAAALADHLRPWVNQHRDAARLAAVADLGLERARAYARALELCVTIETNRK